PDALLQLDVLAQLVALELVRYYFQNLPLLLCYFVVAPQQVVPLPQLRLLALSQFLVPLEVLLVLEFLPLPDDLLLLPPQFPLLVLLELLPQLLGQFQLALLPGLLPQLDAQPLGQLPLEHLLVLVLPLQLRAQPQQLLLPHVLLLQLYPVLLPELALQLHAQLPLEP